MKKPPPRKQPTVKSLRRRKALKLLKGERQRHFITKAQARLLAARHVVNRLFNAATVVDGSMARVKIDSVRRKDTWVVSKIPRGLGYARSTRLVLGDAGFWVTAQFKKRYFCGLVAASESAFCMKPLTQRASSGCGPRQLRRME
ncbi:MAG: hypothetical protein ABSC18_01945 [Verrucomicrobiota bacterium]